MPTAILKMANWMQTLSPSNLSADFYIGGAKRSFSASNWVDLVEFATSADPDSEAEVITEEDMGDKVLQSYAIFKNGKWASIPGKDVKLLCSLDTKTGSFRKAPEHLVFVTFGEQYPGSPTGKRTRQDLGID